MLCVFVDHAERSKGGNGFGAQFSCADQIVGDLLHVRMRRRGDECRRGGGDGLCPSFALLADKHFHRFGKSFVPKLHHEVDWISARTLTVTEPFAALDRQTVMTFPAVFAAAANQFLSVGAQEFCEIDLICLINLCLGVCHRLTSVS